MFKDALRRLLWLGPTLFFVTLPLFWAMARAEAAPVAAGPSGLPLFFNPEPTGARERALVTVGRIARGGPDAAEATERLRRQGGAALPHILSSLDALAPEARGRLATALGPVAKRMQVGSAADLESSEAAALFWSRYWREHAVDFRPFAVQREVRRFAERPSALRFGEVVELDTVALEDLIGAMRPLRSPHDVARVREVCQAAAHVTGNSWTIPKPASVESARRVVERWEDFWLDHRSDYVTLTGTRRLAATVVETRYGRWIEHTFRRGLALARGERSLDPTLRARALVTIWLVLTGCLGGYSLAIGLGALAAFRRHRPLDFALGVAISAVSAFTIVGVATTIARMLGHWHAPLTASLGMMVSTAAVSTRHQRALQARTLEQAHLRTERAFGVPSWRIGIRSLRLSFASMLALATADLPVLLTASFVTERAFSLEGLGDVVLRIARSGSHTSLMALALVLAVGLGVAQTVADLILRLLDRRVPDASARARGAFR